MLYIWPYIVFFSLPLTVVSILRPIVSLFPDGALKALLQSNLVGSSKTSVPGYLFYYIFTTLSLLAVHYNTIIHPFTLADNRHYVFYVFRILRRDTKTKYFVVPLYYICAWMTFQTLSPPSETQSENQPDHENTLSRETGAGRQPCQISFILVWLVTTTLSVVTAPLVEPRYFIIPFIIWRLHVPNIAASLSSKRASGNSIYDMRLVLETVWLLAVNAAIGYNFLYRGFSWPNEPGKIQRFLW
jgi:alpha-1,2-glucosyltransferase